MQLDEAQKQKVAEWIKQGLKLSEIQNRLMGELSVRLTYMEVRLLVDDLKLTPKDVEPRKPSPTLAGAGAPGAPTPGARQPGPAPSQAPAAQAQTHGAPAKIALSVDQLARPGAVVSGKVTFSDGNRAEWYFDQSGRLGLVTQQPGYRPPAADLQEFQVALESELSRMGL